MTNEEANERLLEAIELGKYDDAEQALEDGADPSAKHKEGRPVLTVAVELGYYDIVQLLIVRGADVIHTDCINLLVNKG